jgi:hypothetical protein
VRFAASTLSVSLVSTYRYPALNLEAIALDDALDLLDILVTDIFSEAKKAGERARLRRIKDLDTAAIQLSRVCRLILGQREGRCD